MLRRRAMDYANGKNGCMRTQSGDNRWVRLTQQMHLGQKWIRDRILYLHCTRSLRMYRVRRLILSDLSCPFSKLIPNISGLACQKDKAANIAASKGSARRKCESHVRWRKWKNYIKSWRVQCKCISLNIDQSVDTLWYNEMSAFSEPETHEFFYGCNTNLPSKTLLVLIGCISLRLIGAWMVGQGCQQ